MSELKTIDPKNTEIQLLLNNIIAEMNQSDEKNENNLYSIEKDMKI